MVIHFFDTLFIFIETTESIRKETKYIKTIIHFIHNRIEDSINTPLLLSIVYKDIKWKYEYGNKYKKYQVPSFIGFWEIFTKIWNFINDENLYII